MILVICPYLNMGHVITITTVRMACGDCYVMIALPVSLALGKGTWLIESMVCYKISVTVFVREQTAREKLTLKISLYVEEKRLRKFFVYTRWAFMGWLRKKQNVIYSKVLYTNKDICLIKNARYTKGTTVFV